MAGAWLACAGPRWPGPLLALLHGSRCCAALIGKGRTGGSLRFAGGAGVGARWRDREHGSCEVEGSA